MKDCYIEQRITLAADADARQGVESPAGETERQLIGEVCLSFLEVVP